MKVSIERIECYWARGKGKNRNYRFYVDFLRNAAKDEEFARKEFIKLIKGRDGTEGRGYNWRVTVQTLRAVASLLPDPKVVKAEMERFDVEGVKPPLEPYHVCQLHVSDTHIPTAIDLTFDEVPERFRRACDYWRTTHHLSKDEHHQISLFGGRRMSITQDMLIAFESWLIFDKSWRELYATAFEERKSWEEDFKARQYENDAPFRAQYPDWDEWPSYRQDQERYKVRKEFYDFQERLNNFFREQQTYHFSFTSTSEVANALKMFELPQNTTLQDIKKRYKTLAKQYHPDMPTGDTEKFKKINNANEVLIRQYGNE